MRLFKCSLCDLGRRAPEKMHRDDVRRFCFGCSEKTGRLVRLVVPTLCTQKVKAKARRVQIQAEKRAREAKREWQRLHTWPGVRELRWAKWSSETLRPARGVSIGDAYVEMFRLGMPMLGPSPSPAAIAAVRRSYLRRVGIRGDAVEIIANERGRTPEFASAREWVKQQSLGWLIEDLGIEDAESRQAIRAVAEKTNPGDVDDVAILNNVILNAFELVQLGMRGEDKDDDSHEPIGGWQGA